MAELLKNIYNDSFFKEFTNALAQVLPLFDAARFEKLARNEQWEHLEIKQRMAHLAGILNITINKDYKKSISLIIKLVQVLRQGREHAQSLPYMLLPAFIEIFGTDDFETSMKGIEEVTQFASCEFAIRPFIKKYPDQAMARMLLWADHKNENVRRFSSEGCRPRLPWAMALPGLRSNPTAILPILEKLKNDPAEYVRRSVANNLNDISKDNPNVVIQLARKWQHSTKETDWVIKHGCRTLLKKANKDTLSLLGLSPTINCAVKHLTLEKSPVKKGEHLIFSFDIVNQDKLPVKLRVEYAIYYVKIAGKVSRKLFKITENSFDAGRTYSFKRKQSFEDMTTRKHNIGLHKIAIVLNGNEMAGVDFVVE